MEDKMGVDFKLSREQPQGKPDIAVFHLGGWLDAQSEQKLVDAVQKAKDEGAQYVLLDMRDMDTITSAGIRAIHKSYQILTPKDAGSKIMRLKMCNAPPQIYQVLGMTGLLINVPMYENETDAIDSFGG
jgi:anti-anti-sigma factor